MRWVKWAGETFLLELLYHATWNTSALIVVSIQYIISYLVLQFITHGKQTTSYTVAMFILCKKAHLQVKSIGHGDKQTKIMINMQTTTAEKKEEMFMLMSLTWCPGLCKLYKKYYTTWMNLKKWEIHTDGQWQERWTWRFRWYSFNLFISTGSIGETFTLALVLLSLGYIFSRVDQFNDFYFLPLSQTQYSRKCTE